jgi:hypothetical protein
MPITLHDVRRYHEALPQRLRSYLNARGIPNPVVDLHLLGWNGHRITIPIFDRAGNLAFVKGAKDPRDRGLGPKMLCPPGAKTELYGWERLRANPPRIVICEGEFDRLVLEARGIAAVTSTGGARVFRPEWVAAFASVEDVYVCFDRDEAGRLGAARVASLLPKAKVVALPSEIGPGGDVTDFFVRFGRTKQDFLTLLASAAPLPERSPAPSNVYARREDGIWPQLKARIERVKACVPIERVIEAHVVLRRSGERLTGLCPFHDDRYPSFMVYPVQRSFHCFGCGAHGDVLTFLMSIKNQTFREALDDLEDTYLSHGDAEPAA